MRYPIAATGNSVQMKTILVSDFAPFCFLRENAVKDWLFTDTLCIIVSTSSGEDRGGRKGDRVLRNTVKPTPTQSIGCKAATFLLGSVSEILL